MTMTNASLVARAQNGKVRDDDPAPKPTRRRFSTEYKRSILEEYDRLTEPGTKGALLRREGLYSSHLIEWRRAMEAGAISGLDKKHRKKRSDAEREVERLRKRNARLEDQLAKHRVVLEAQGKASELLARLLAESADTENEQQL
jgi:transposase-like protein